MSHKSLTVWLFVFSLLLSSTFALAQDADDARIFKLLRDSSSARDDLNLEDEEIQAWDPAVEAGTIEFSFGLGMLGLSQTLLQQDQVIYKYTPEATFWGDVELKGETAFNPLARLGYNINRWLSIEALGGVSFCKYSSTITNRQRRPNEQGAPVDFVEPALGEFDAEERSLITLQGGVNAVIYPLAIRGDGKGRWHPYVTAGAGRMWYDMNSNYTDESASSFDVNFGGGIRLLADRNISLRLEIMFRRNTLEWMPPANFLELDEGTLLVPMNEYPVQADGSFNEQPIESYDSLDMNLLNFSIGFQGSF